MALFINKANCKKCKELVLYTWRKCPYCNCRRFDRQSTNLIKVREEVFGDSFEWPRDQLTEGGCLLYIISGIWFIFALMPCIDDLNNALSGTIDSVFLLVRPIVILFAPILIVLALCSVYWVFTYVILFCLYYCIFPFFHFFGKKVTCIEIAQNRDYNREFGLTSIKYINDQDVLYNIAINDSRVRDVAAEKLTDQALLAKVALNGKFSDVRMIAAENLIDQTLAQKVYADIAKNGANSYVRKAAIEKLTDQDELADIAKNDTDRYVRNGAVAKLTDQDVLAYVAKNDTDRDVRNGAVAKLTDQDVLAYVAKNDEYINVRITAAEKLSKYELEEKLLMYLIRMLGNELKNSGCKHTCQSAAFVLMSLYKRYGKSEFGKEFKKYEGTYSGGYSDSGGHSYVNMCGTISYESDHSDTGYSIVVKFKNEDS